MSLNEMGYKDRRVIKLLGEDLKRAGIGMTDQEISDALHEMRYQNVKFMEKAKKFA